MTAKSFAQRQSNDEYIRGETSAAENRNSEWQSSQGDATHPHKPISITLTSSGLDRVYPDSTYVLGVTVHNHGTQDAVILLFIDEHAPELRQWCPAMQKRLALAADQTGEVIFEFQVPPTALPEIFRFDLVADASDSYASLAPLRLRNRQLQVLAAEQQTDQSNDPTFWLEPRTSPAEPLIAQPGIATPLEIWVENRSNLVDRFRLICTGLPEDWAVAITYPKDETSVGLVTETQSLGLNPGARGPILVTITAPDSTLAGNYIPTLRLHCANNPELGLLDLVYLNVPQVYALTPQIQTLQRKVNNRPARFEINLANLGNTDRYLHLELQDLEEQQHCKYKLACSEVKIAPRSIAQIPLSGLPQGLWQRPWFGAGKLYNFRILLSDTESHPVTPTSLESYLTWQARPIWQLLLVVLSILGGLGAIAWAIWWFLFLPTTTVPKVLEFAASDSQYTALRGDVARVGWRIHNHKKLKAIQITGYGDEGEVLSGPIQFDLSQGLPTPLQSFCSEQKTLLSCNSVRTDALEPGQYTFELALIPKAAAKEPILSQSQSVTIAAKPIPTATQLTPSKLIYHELNSKPDGSNTPIIDPQGVRLSWNVTHPNQLAAIKISGKTTEGESLGELIYEFPQLDGKVVLPTELSKTCKLHQELICQNIPTGLSAVGKYQFELQAIPREDVTPLAAVTSEIVTIQPKPPLFQGFFLNGQNAPAKLQIPASPRGIPPSVSLSWFVDEGSSTKVELLPSPGHVPARGSLVLPLPPQGSTTMTLQITDTNTGKTTSRATTIETFDPSPADPEEIAITAAANAAKISSEATAAMMAQQNATTSALMAQQAEAFAQARAIENASRTSEGTGISNAGQAAQQGSRKILKPKPMPLAPLELPPQLQ